MLDHFSPGMEQFRDKQPTLRDVADIAGVSYQTVWRVVNDHPHVAKDTREKVLRAIQDLDYRPNRAAQVLITGRSYMLQLIAFDWGYDPAVAAMLHWARAFGYIIAVTELQEPKSIEAVRTALEVTANVVDGALLVAPRRHFSMEVLRDLCQDRPFVLVSTELGVKLPSVIFDQRHGTEQVVRHLFKLGHRHIAEICGPPESSDAHIRHETLEQMLATQDFEPGPRAVGDWSSSGGYQAAKHVLESNAPFTALVVANDRMALGAMRALREAGVCVPQDVSVVGFDDEEVAQFCSPPLTTVRQDFSALGKTSVEYLVSLIEDPSTPVQQRVLYPELVVRESTRPVMME